MKKLLIGLLAIGSISTFAQNVPGFKMPVPSEPNGIVVTISRHHKPFKIEVAEIEDRGDTVVLKDLLFKSAHGPSRYGILRKYKNILCEDMGFGERVHGSLVMVRKNVTVITHRLMIPGPNRVIGEIECNKNVPGFKMPAPSEPNGTAVIIARKSIPAKIEAAELEDKGDTVVLKGLLFISAHGNSKYGILKEYKDALCEKMGFDERVHGSLMMVRKNVPVIAHLRYIPGPNRVIGEIECTKRE